MIKQLGNEFIKNIKIMFRNWTSLSLLVLAPLVFILLVGYAFSGEDLTGITIGIVSEQPVDLTPLAMNVSNYAVLEEYSSTEGCLSDLVLQKIHLCIVLEGMVLTEKNTTNFGDFPSGNVIYYYDNTRKKISLALIQNIQGFFGLKAEQVSIESAEDIIENIQTLIAFLNERKADINEMKNESVSIKNDLIERKQKLEKVRADFLPPYYVVKDLQYRLHNYSSRLDNSTAALDDSINTVIFNINKLENNKPFQLFLDQTNNTGLIIAFRDLEKELLVLTSLVNSTTTDIHLAIATVDELVSNLDAIKLILDEEIARNDEYIAKIDKSVAKIDELSTEMESKLEKLSSLQPGMAEKLVKPILYEYNLVLKGVKNIQLSFPQLLVLIVMFIALIFSNISTLTEIHNKAYLRNLIAPVDDIIYVLGMILTSIIVVFFQIVVLFIVAQTRLGVNIFPLFWEISLITLLLITLFVLIGTAFAYLFKTVQGSILITTFASLIFFLFSNALAPIEAMPNFARFISSYNPIVIGEYLLKEIQLFNLDLSSLMSKVLLLMAYICILFLIVVLLAKDKNRKR